MVSLLPCVYLGIGSELLLAMRKVSFEPPQSTAPPSLHCLWKGPRVHSDMVRGQGPSLFLLSPSPEHPWTLDPHKDVFFNFGC